MKQQLRCYEAEVCDLYEAKHTPTFSCGETTLHERSSLHFSYTVRCASFAPQATADDIPAVFLRHYPAYKNKQLNVSELARVCDLSRTTVYKYLSLLET